MARLSIAIITLLLLLSLSSASPSPPSKDISIDTPLLQFSVPSNSCERIHVVGLSRLKFKNYADLRVISLKTEGSYGKVEICAHRNASIGVCRCEKDKWQSVMKGQWSLEMSPYDNRYIDVRFKERTSGIVTVKLDEGLQQWRLVFLGVGFILFLAAPIVCDWVPFYYSSSMTLGVLLLVLIIVFQGMKLLPFGRKNALYVTVLGSLVGVGTLVLDYFATALNSILMNLGVSDELHNPVSVFLLVGIVLAGAGFGYWIVQKYILSQDGRVDTGVAQFVRWAMRFIGMICFSQSTLDPLLGLMVLCTSALICYLITSRQWRSAGKQHHTHLKPGALWPQRIRQASASKRNAEFLSRSPGMMDLGRNVRQSSNNAYAYPNSSLKAPVLAIAQKPAYEDQSYYSSFHKTLTPRKYSKREWDDLTRETTSEALQEWASSPEVSRWIADNHKRIQLDNFDNPDASSESSSGSSEETDGEGSGGLNLFRWR